MGTLPGTAFRYMVDVAFPCTSGDCLIWPYGRDGKGYAQIKIEKRMHSVHRIVCMRTHGNPTEYKPEAAHSCGNGHLGCVNPQHLRWASAGDNQSERFLHARNGFGQSKVGANVKLCAVDVLKIRNAEVKTSRAEIAKRYGISISAVRNIRSRKTWAWL